MKQKLFLIILLACLFIFILIAFLFSAFLGSVITQKGPSTRCKDSDGGINTYVKGSVSLCVNENCTLEAEDTCDANYVVEYYCTNFGNVASRLSKCTFGCFAGECLHIGEEPKVEEEKNITFELEGEIKEMICDEGWLCEQNIRGFRGADCAWIKEEYCKYGCEEGECVMPSWWGRFVFWLRNAFS